MENTRQWWNTWILVQEIHLHSRQNSTRSELQEAHVPEWMTKGKATLIQKDSLKGTAPNKHRLITCQSKWKLLAAQIREGVYYSLTSQELFPDIQKGCCKGSRSIETLLYIDQHILNKSKIRQKKSSYSMNWQQKRHMISSRKAR